MRQLLTTLAECAGFIIVTASLAVVSVPVAGMFAGGSLITVGILLGRDL